MPAEFLWLQGGFAGWLAQVCPHALDLGGIFRHGLFGGLEHVVTVVRHGLAIGAGMYWLGISATILTLIGLEALSYLFKSIGMKSSMVEFSTDNKETLNRMAKKFNSKEYNIVSYQLDEKRLGEVTTYYVTMVIKSKKYNDEGMLLTLLQDFSDITVHRLE